MCNVITNRSIKGFTLIELLVVLATTRILAALDAALNADYGPASVVPQATVQTRVNTTLAASNIGGSQTFLRLREGVEPFLVTDIKQPAASARLRHRGESGRRLFLAPPVGPAMFAGFPDAREPHKCRSQFLT